MTILLKEYTNIYIFTVIIFTFHYDIYSTSAQHTVLKSPAVDLLRAFLIFQISVLCFIIVLRLCFVFTLFQRSNILSGDLHSCFTVPSYKHTSIIMYLLKAIVCLSGPVNIFSPLLINVVLKLLQLPPNDFVCQCLLFLIRFDNVVGCFSGVFRDHAVYGE